MLTSYDGYISPDDIKSISKEMDRDLKKTRAILRKLPLTENFGQSEIRKLRDKYSKIKYCRSLSSIYDRINYLDNFISELI